MAEVASMQIPPNNGSSHFLISILKQKKDVTEISEADGTRFTLTPKAAIVSGKVILDKIEVVDLLGRLQYSTVPSTQEVKITTSRFSPGTYFLITYEQGKMFAYKFKL